MSSKEENLSKMMKKIQNSLKNKENIEQIQTGGGVFDNIYNNYVKKYLDMIFNKEKELKKEQKDSLAQLTEIKEKIQIQTDQEENQNMKEEEQSLLAKKEEDIENSKQKSLILKDQSSTIYEEALELERQAQEKKNIADQQLLEAKYEVENNEFEKKTLEEAMEIKKKSMENSDKLMRTFLKGMENKELVNLEETQESIEENQSIQEIQSIVNSGILQKKTDDLLF